MPSTTGRLALKARWVFPVVQRPLADGLLTMEGPRIVAVGANSSGAPARDLGDVALLPGFVNPHTHLEFSELRRPLGEPGITFPDWIAQVVAWRRGAAPTTDPREPQAAAVAAGLRESLACGVTTLGDIATADAAAATTREHRIAIVSFRELMGLSAGRIARQVEIARGHLNCLRGDGRRRGGLGPHAPYTTHPEVVARACRLSRQSGVPVAMHLAESEEEMELLATGGGPLRELLSQLGSWVPTAVRAGTSSGDYLELLGTGHRSLVVHGNYLGPGDWEFLASRAATMAVVYCPRTHAYFRHARYP
ncbi:MAG: amidohydrolase family protein, partial [Planctomycetes bacterium]|nr:amidohydrolase family protein [Planctomycetota bacterium]